MSRIESNPNPFWVLIDTMPLPEALERMTPKGFSSEFHRSNGVSHLSFIIAMLALICWMLHSAPLKEPGEAEFLWWIVAFACITLVAVLIYILLRCPEVLRSEALAFYHLNEEQLAQVLKEANAAKEP